MDLQILRDYMNQHEAQMLEDLKTLIRIPSERMEAKPGMPYGEPAAKVLEAAMDMISGYGFKVKNYDNYVIAADFNDNEKKLDILAHLDVVPAGEGWTITEPFEPKIVDGKIYGRGTCDDKGPAIAALYAMRALKDLGVELPFSARLILGSDEECGSSDLRHYYGIEKEAEYTFSPDADFPVINVEKGGMRGVFTKKVSACTEGVRIVSVNAGTKVNVVPGKAKAVVAGMSKEALTVLADAVTKETGVVFEISDGLEITAVGVGAHAAHPSSGNNALTALILLLSRIPVESTEVHDAFTFINKVYPHGDWLGEALGIAQTDEISGELTLSFTMFSFDGVKMQGTFDCRAPLCANDENARFVARDKLAEGGFVMEDTPMFPPHYVAEDSPLVQTLLDCYHDVTGLPKKTIAIGGGTYVHHLKGGVAFGCGREWEDTRMHGADEFMDIAHMKECAVIFAEAIERLCSC